VGSVALWPELWVTPVLWSDDLIVKLKVVAMMRTRGVRMATAVQSAAGETIVSKMMPGEMIVSEMMP
jgi:hypothetical protein